MVGNKRDILFDVEGKKFATFEGANEVVSNLNGTYASRGAGVDEVAGAKGDETRNVGNEVVNIENHIATVAFLFGLAVDGEVEIEVVDGFAKVGELDKRSYNSTAVETFGYKPGHAALFESALDVASSEVDTKSNGVVVFVGKFGLDAFAEAVDADNEFELMLYILRKVGIEEGQLFGVKGAVGFHKEYGFGGNGRLHFFGMGRIVAHNTEDFHVNVIFIIRYSFILLYRSQ